MPAITAAAYVDGFNSTTLMRAPGTDSAAYVASRPPGGSARCWS